MTTPQIDKRTREELVNQMLGNPEAENPLGLRDLYTPRWTSRDPDDPGVVMVHLFARLMDTIIQRLNGVPDKNFMAFLELAGIDRLPGNPARAPLQFTLSGISGGEVPEGTRVATTQTETNDAVIFETERTFFLSPRRLESIFSIYPQEDKYANLIKLVDAEQQAPVIIFSPEFQPSLEHVLYIGHDTLLDQQIPVNINLNITTAEAVSIPDEFWEIEWRGYIGGEWTPLTVLEDQTDKLRLGPVETGSPPQKAGRIIRFQNVSGLEKVTVNDIETFWIQAVLSTPAPLQLKLPLIESLSIVIAGGSTGEEPSQSADQGFFNNIPLDISKDFYPFGETPKFNDTFYFANEEIFSKKGQTVSIMVALTPDGSIPRPLTEDITLRWEYYRQIEGEPGQWVLLGESNNSGSTTTEFTDETNAFTQTGEVTFTCPEEIARSEVNGVENYWLRVRIVGGNYGEPAGYEPDGNGGFVYNAATYRPPSIATFELSYAINPANAPGAAAQHCLAFNQLKYDNHIENGTLIPFVPFQAVDDNQPALYLGFDDAFADALISIYWAIREEVVPPVIPGAATELALFATEDKPNIAWEYFNGAIWNRLSVLDGTDNFNNRGTVEFLGPSDFAATTKLGLQKYWIRTRLASGTFEKPPEIEGIYFNTVMASNILTQKDELVGSGNGEADQRFVLSQVPVLDEEEIYVREPELPPDDDKAALEEVYGDSAVIIRTNNRTGEDEFWLRWMKVDNFYGSALNDRHYTLDRVTGEIRFGDGTQGMSAPLGRNNIMAFFYQAGGSAVANQAATRGEIKELKSSLPFVDKAVNVSNAEGGSDPETNDQARTRGSQTIKNRNRAITAQDFEWLTRQASTQVALVRCLPTTNKHLQFQPGAVTLLVVPHSDDPKPLPSIGLIEYIESYLSERTEATVSENINVIGPHYLRIDVMAIVQPADPGKARTVEQEILNNLSAFFHPLTGGPDQEGWSFARDVYISEVYEVIEDTLGVDHVETLRIRSSIWENRLVFVDPLEQFQEEMREGSTVSSADGQIKLSLTEPISARQTVASINIRGFQIGDRVRISSGSGDPLTESHELEITGISKNTLYFDTFKLSFSFNKGDRVVSSDGAIQMVLNEDLSAHVNLNDILVKAFEGSGFSVVVRPQEIAVGESKTVARVEEELQRIYLNDYALVYSGVHDIQMI